MIQFSNNQLDANILMILDTRDQLILSDFMETIESARRKIPLFIDDDLHEWFRHCNSPSRAIALSGLSDYDLSEAYRNSKSFASVLRLLVTALARGYIICLTLY